MKILVTGAAGFIGSNFCHWLIENTEHTIIGVDDLSGGFEENLPDHERFAFAKINVSDHYLHNVFQIYKPSVCYHLAAYAAEGRSNYIRSFIHSNNTVGTASVINACLNNNCKLIFTSSVAVYSGNPPFDEETIPNPIDEYGLSKYCSELSIEIAAMQGLDYCIIRPRNVYGIRQNLFDPARNLWGIWCYQALNNKPITIYGDGSNKRSFTYIDDILEPLYNVIGLRNQVINLGSGNVYSIQQAAEIFQEVTGYDKVTYLPPRHEVTEAYCDIFKSQRLIDFKDETTIYAGVKKMWVWAKTVPMQKRQEPPQLEVFKTNHVSIV